MTRSHSQFIPNYELRIGRPSTRFAVTPAQGSSMSLWAWSVDRLGRSLQDLIAFLSELHALKVDLFLKSQGIDTKFRNCRLFHVKIAATVASHRLASENDQVFRLRGFANLLGLIRASPSEIRHLLSDLHQTGNGSPLADRINALSLP
jgi:Resolvase, N terminal domain